MGRQASLVPHGINAYAGPFAGQEKVYKTIQISEDAPRFFRIMFDWVEVGTWDGESMNIVINDTLFVSEHFRHRETDSDHTYSKNMTDQLPLFSHHHNASQGLDQVHRFDVRFQMTDEALVLLDASGNGTTKRVTLTEKHFTITLYSLANELHYGDQSHRAFDEGWCLANFFVRLGESHLALGGRFETITGDSALISNAFLEGTENVSDRLRLDFQALLPGNANAKWAIDHISVQSASTDTALKEKYAGLAPGSLSQQPLVHEEHTLSKLLSFVNEEKRGEDPPTKFLRTLGAIGSRFAGVFAGTDKVRKMIVLQNHHPYVELLFDFLRVDWWDNYLFSVSLNDVEFFSQSYHSHSSGRLQVFGTAEGHRRIESLGRDDGGWDHNHDQVIHCVLRCHIVPQESGDKKIKFLDPDGRWGGKSAVLDDTLRLDFSSNHTSAHWAISNMVVRSAQTLKQLDAPTSPETLTYQVNGVEIANDTLFTTYLDTYEGRDFFSDNHVSWTLSHPFINQTTPTGYANDARFGHYLGPFYHTEQVTKEITLTDLEKYVLLEFDFLRIDRWWNYYFKLFVNNTQLFRQQYYVHERFRVQNYGMPFTHYNILGVGRYDYHSAGHWDWNFDQPIHFAMYFKAGEDNVYTLLDKNGQATTTTLALTDKFELNFAAEGLPSHEEASWGITNVRLMSASDKRAFEPPKTDVVATVDTAFGAVSRTDDLSNWIDQSGNAVNPSDFTIEDSAMQFLRSVANTQLSKTLTLDPLGPYFQLRCRLLRETRWLSGDFKIHINGTTVWDGTYVHNHSSTYPHAHGVLWHDSYQTRVFDFDIRFVYADNMLKLLDPNNQLSGITIGTDALMDGTQLNLPVTFEMQSSSNQDKWGVNNIQLRSFGAFYKAEEESPF